MNRRTFITSAVAAATAITILPQFARNALAKNMTVFTGKTDGVAINGYDPVAYHTMNKPVQGSKDHVANWNGVDWYFSSAENQKMFEENPEKYAPQYGGHCAYGAAQGYAVKTEPDAFSVVDGKLYLNYNQGVKTKWMADQSNLIKMADEKWPELSGQ